MMSVRFRTAGSVMSASDAVDGSSTGTRVPRSHNSEEPVMQTVTTIGLDIAKSVFQVHGVDAAGQGVIRRRLLLDKIATLNRRAHLITPSASGAREGLTYALLGLGTAVETRVCAVTMVMQITAMISIATT